MTTQSSRKPFVNSAIACLLLAAASSLAFAADPPLSLGDAQKILNQTKDKKEYESYMDDFALFNNYHHLDSKDDCYAKGNGPVDLYLVIKAADDQQSGVIDQVLSNVDNPKAACLKKSYKDVPTKAPPYSPFIVPMKIG